MTRLGQPIPKPFELVAGHVALDLVNTLNNRFSETGPEELLASYDDVLRFTAQSGLLTKHQTRNLRCLAASEAKRATVIDEVKELREAMAAIAYARLDGKNLSVSALVTVEDYFKQAGSHRHLSAGRLRPVWSWRGLDCEVGAPVWLLAQAAVDFLVSESYSQLRCCASETCRWMFLDASKNRTRRWCDMKVCGNRMKARRFYARKAE
jgi:predicted RNA-binding Zn ribbon-like protein